MQKRLLRLTWNKNNWEIPSGHRWSKKKQGNSAVAFENQYGFGGEEWLFNGRYNVLDFQYGYIRGLMEVTNIDFIDEVYLFSIEPNTKARLLIAKLRNVELLDPDDLPQAVTNTFIKYNEEMLCELLNVNADSSNFKPREFYPCVRFRMEDAEVFDVPIEINELRKNGRYNRFKPYIVDTPLQKIINGKLVANPFYFNPGKRKNDNAAYLKRISSKSVQVAGLHAEIVNELENYLKPEFSIAKNNISIEKTIFGGNISDVVISHHDNTFTIYEVKTSHNTRYNIRDALGQLLDYSLWHENIRIKHLVIVAPGKISIEHTEYLKRLKAHLKLDIKFLHYTSFGLERFKEINFE